MLDDGGAADFPAVLPDEAVVAELDPELPDEELAAGTGIGSPYWLRGGVVTGCGCVPRNCVIVCCASGSWTTWTSP